MSPTLHRLRVCTAGLLAWLAETTSAQPPAAPGAASTPAPLPAWELTGNFRLTSGYKENLLLSALRSEDSVFAQAEGEVFLWRLPTETVEALAFANATFTRFFQSATDPHEWQAFAHAEVRWFAAQRLQLTASGEGYHLDQIFDLSATDAERTTARLAVTGGIAAAALRWDARPDTWLELKPAIQRDRYDDGSDDNTQQLVRGTLGRKFLSNRLEVAVSAQVLQRRYDYRPRYTTAGRPLVGTELIFRQREGELRGTVTWDRAKHWTSTTTLTAGTNGDNGSGYFDYRHRAVRQEIAWSRAPWKVRLTGRAGRYEYDVQTQGIGINPPKRMKEEYRIAARAERQWTEQTRIYADLSWERSRSNDPLANYRSRSAGAGVDWMF